jgi:hypothetical protein
MLPCCVDFTEKFLSKNLGLFFLCYRFLAVVRFSRNFVIYRKIRTTAAYFHSSAVARKDVNSYEMPNNSETILKTQARIEDTLRAIA